LQEQLQKLRSDMQDDVMYIDISDIEDSIVNEDVAVDVESDLCIDLNDIR